jgi:hypothetical protein
MRGGDWVSAGLSAIKASHSIDKPERRGLRPLFRG